MSPPVDALSFLKARDKVRRAIVSFCEEHKDQDMAAMLRMADETLAVWSSDELREHMGKVAALRDEMM